MGEIGYFAMTPSNEWSILGALGSIARGAGMGAFGSTIIGGAYFALKGIYDGVQVWRNPNASPLQKVLGSANILVGVASAYALRGQMRSQVNDWLNVYSRIPLRAQIQTDIQAIRAAFNNGDELVTLGGVTIRFSRDAPPGYMGMSGTSFGAADEIVLTQNAIRASDDELMRSIIEENLHNFRASSSGIGGATGLSRAIIETEEKWVGDMVETVFSIGRERSWW